jgi:uracil-DNA glycosylase
MSDLDRLKKDISACRVCANVLPADVVGGPRPVVQLSARARLCIVGQAPGARVHASGIPFNDPSGDRLRDWMGIDRTAFYDPHRLAIVPMGFCYPGTAPKGGDYPPRPECAPLWQDRVFTAMPQVETILLIGLYAQRWRLSAHEAKEKSVTERVQAFAAYMPRFFPLPHPSWRNSGWLKAHPWFETDVLPHLRQVVARLMPVI